MKKVLSAALVFIVVFQINAQLRVSSSGNVGIGVTSLGSKLHVKGNGLFVSSTSSITSAPYIRGTNAYSSVTTPDFTWWNNDQTGLYHPGAGKIGVAINGVERMMFDNSKIRLHGSHPNTGGLEIGDVNFIGAYSMISIYPKRDWYGSLGTPNKRFGGGYIDHVWASVYTTTSDERLKENIEDLDVVLPKVMQLHAVKYDLKPRNNGADIGANKQINPPYYKNRMGFLAQEIKDVFPSIVEIDTTIGYYGVNYMDLIPVLVEAIKEQQIQIDALKYQQQTTDNTKRESEEAVLAHATHLNQNFPNPFNTETSVSYFITPEAKSASIMIFDMKGTLLRRYDNLEKGNGQIIIEAEEFTPGMYMYSLIVNGEELDNKRMILTD